MTPAEQGDIQRVLGRLENGQEMLSGQVKALFHKVEAIPGQVALQQEACRMRHDARMEAAEGRIGELEACKVETRGMIRGGWAILIWIGSAITFAVGVYLSVRK